MNQAPLLCAEQLTCIREDRLLFDRLSFSVSGGDIIQIAGENGSGKTSLLRILAGLSTPYEGKVTFNGSTVHANREAFNEQLLYLGHLAGIKNELSTLENIDFNLSLHNQAHSKPEQLLEQVNLGGFESHPAGHLSAGQHRRTALARLFVGGRPLWILDEPFTAIDKKGVEILENLILEHANQGGAVILTTHQAFTVIKPERLSIITLEHREF